MQASRQPLLIAALSGRMLAASALRGGRSAIVLDLFNDVDTRHYALHSRAIVDEAGGLGASALLQGANEFYSSCDGIVIGSGFEDKTELMQELLTGRIVYGNTTETVKRMKDPTYFYNMLDALDISHPEISLHQPEQLSDWLVKQVGASGGAHIQWAHRAASPQGKIYYQRFVRGKSMSVLFVANGAQAQILGINEQWTVAMRPEFPFCYGGAIGKATLEQPLYQRVEKILDRILQTSGLVGLNGMDFILHDDDILVLEINPRPTATVDLYDGDWSEGLLAVHLRACRGELPDTMPQDETIRAHAIVYASAPMRVTENFVFPDWCSDIPQANSTICLHAPICTVHASGVVSAAVKLELQQRQALITDATRTQII